MWAWCCLSLVASICGLGASSDLSEWRAESPPARGSDGGPGVPIPPDAAVWVVSMTNSHVIARRTAWKQYCRWRWETPRFEVPLLMGPEPTSKARVSDGWLVGSDTEFARGVWWFSLDGRTRYQVAVPDLLTPQIVGFVRGPEDLYVLHGVPSYDSGEIWRVTKAEDGSRWKMERFATLRHGPYIAAPYGEGCLVVVTWCGLETVDSDARADLVLTDAFWRGAPPLSVVVDAEEHWAYVSFDAGVAKIGLQGGERARVIWLRPPDRESRSETNEGGGPEEKGEGGQVPTGRRGVSTINN